MPTAIRDASLTTLKRKQRALAAYRASYATVSSVGYPVGFPFGNSIRPEQPNTQTGDVPVNARLGAALLGCCSSAADDGYGQQGPSNVSNATKF